MAIIIVLWETIILFICSIMQSIMILVSGIAGILSAIVDGLHKLHDWILGCVNIKSKKKKAHIDIPL